MALALFLVETTGCSRTDVSAGPRCDGGLASVNGVVITSMEVDLLVADSATAGATLSKVQGLKDLVWQESERQRLGLPGGQQIRESRRAAVRRYRRSRLDREPIDTEGQLPEGVVILPCGAALWRSRP